MRATPLIMALLLVPAAAQARHRTPAAPQPTTAERIDAIAPGEVVDVPDADPASTMVRNQIDVRFGPADLSTPARAVWLAEGLDRDTSMRRAGIGRLVLTRTPTGLRISAETISSLAAR